MDLNTILIIAGVVVLIGLVAHGLWANRREKSKYFESASAFERDVEQVSSMQQYDDQIVNRPAFTNSEPMQPNQSNQVGMTISNPSFNAQPDNPQPVRQPLQFEPQPEYGYPSHADSSIQSTPPESLAMPESDVASQVQPTQPQSVEQIKITLPDSQPDEIQQVQPKESSYYAQTEQNISGITISEAEQFDEEDGINTSSVQLRVQLQEAAQGDLQPAFQTKTEEAQQHEQVFENRTFITLYVVAAENRTFQGVMLEQALETLGFKLGQDKLYHSHLNLDETEPVLFSVANIKQPGTFEQNHIFEFSTQGVVLFMGLPSVGNDRVNLKMMIRAADQLAKMLNGFVLTDHQELFTEEAEAEYLARLD